ncbi:hypothetical protein CONCODRAFT_13355 [Conidiobolus coronatus NRRL 28638]|uniref:Uncharacterized protein n=1 Tax=Conidiobolus coronatus (strain ATCC 28846 / CBS 209.66 / NRRL 28638) TaxID=796925 RepID=A0A137NR06_CONC2|nr:hypothetical protein CONCODRAFT_13355 [Conidiobolus coronatus NRRL 28638]|eukprot:KXN65165.1 hypothetical protein CONCODRAFT_13355 [Conidiobolus coronatus NRRL 28638]
MENWSFGGATTNNGLTSTSILVPSLQDQLMWFKLKGNSCYSNKTPKHLVSYMAGVNNYLDPKITPEATISDIRRHLKVLIKDLGFKNIFISDIPPINEAPIFTGNHLKPGQDRGNVRNDPNIKSKVDKHNLLMKDLINSARSAYPQVNLYFYQFSTFGQLHKR